MGRAKSRLNSSVINASEIGQYTFCSVAWFLQRCGYKPSSESLDVGAKLHAELGEAIDYTKHGAKKSKLLAYTAYTLLALGILLVLFEVIK